MTKLRLWSALKNLFAASRSPMPHSGPLSGAATTPATIKLDGGGEARVVSSPANAGGKLVATQLQIAPCPGVLLLCGGAGLMDDRSAPASLSGLEEVFDAVAETVSLLGSAVIDGGTDAGVMRLMGAALQRHHGSAAPYIGVLPALAEVSPQGPLARDILEPHHSHFVLVESNQWGEEKMIMDELATHLTGGKPAVVLLVNGGAVALQEVQLHVERGRPIIVLQGSGRLADELAAEVLSPQPATRPEVQQVARSGRITVFHLDSPIEQLVELLIRRLKGDNLHESNRQK